MKKLNREKVIRMVGSEINNRIGISSSGGSGGGGLAGAATQAWVGANYVSIEFFGRLFKTYDANGNEVLPNDTETVIDNIKAMVGFWTEQYVSALGQGTGGGGGGASALSDLLDVEINNPTNGQSLVYDSALSKWVNAAGSGVDMDTVWRYLAQSSTQQIDISHLTTALTRYATQQWVSDNYLTKTSAASVYLSKNDAAETYLTKTVASTTYLSIDFFNRLFRAYNGETLVNPNDTTSTIDNIKAMFGFWTEQYVSALGQGTGGGGGGGVGDVTWDLLANNSDTRQIALSHLTTALSGYALTSQIPTNNNQLTNGAGYITSSALTGYATQAWANGQFLKLSGGTLTGNLTVESVEIGHTNEINALQSSNLYLQYRNSGNLILCYNGAKVGVGAINTPSYELHVSGSIGGSSLSIANGGRINVQGQPSGAALYIGNSGNQGWVRVQDMCSQSGTAGDSSGWSIRTNGNALFANVQSNGYVTALSDERKKDVVGDVNLTVEQIAKARTVLFRWKDKRDNDLHMGCIAQDWQVLTPQLVHDRNDELSMEYSVIAAIGTIKNSQRLVNHESRLMRLEKMLGINKNY